MIFDVVVPETQHVAMLKSCLTYGTSVLGPSEIPCDPSKGSPEN